jgi:hypothetical protein
MDESQAVLQDSHLYILDDERGLFTITEVYDEKIDCPKKTTIFHLLNTIQMIRELSPTTALPAITILKSFPAILVEEGEGIFVRAEEPRQ